MSGDFIHQLYAGIAPWLALSLLLLGRNPYLGRLRIIGSLILGFVILRLPWEGWPLFRWIAVLEPNPSFILTGLLVIALGERISGRQIFRPCDWMAAWIFGSVAALILYPIGLGLTDMDPYAWGREPILHIVKVLVTTCLLLSGNRFGMLLLLPMLGFLFHIQESRNFWDALIDPFYGIVALIAVLVLVIRKIKA